MADPFLPPQQALETAVLNALIAQGGPGGAPLPRSQCKRTYDEQPPPFQGNVFYCVWSDGAVINQGQKTRYEELLGCAVTVTVRFTKPFDQWLEHRDDCTARCYAVRDLIGLDQRNFSIINAANTLAGFRSSGDQITAAPPGFVESLFFSRIDPMRNAGPDWFHAVTPPESLRQVGVAMTVRFINAKRIRRVTTV